MLKIIFNKKISILQLKNIKFDFNLERNNIVLF